MIIIELNNVLFQDCYYRLYFRIVIIGFFYSNYFSLNKNSRINRYVIKGKQKTKYNLLLDSKYFKYKS